MIRITGLNWVPPFVQGYVRDLSVRWALEEAGLPYQVRLVTREEQASAEYRSQQQPFGQVPVFEEDGLILFESGGIVLHIAERSRALLPENPNARAQVKSWMFAAMNSIDPVIQNFSQLNFAKPDEPGLAERKTQLTNKVKVRLTELSKWMGGRPYLVGEFSAADILMVMALRNLGPEGILEELTNLGDYVQRGESRPGFQKALADHMKSFSKV